MKRHWRAEDAPDKPESSKRRDVDAKDRSNESKDVDDPILWPDHKIFLSHSGAQKEFVEQLCRDLENCYRFPFFDRRQSSLPKGERFPELILKAAQQCQMAVVVVSEDYFLSKWPMIELNAFVQARLLRSNPKLKILPLFYQLSVQEFCDERRRGRWFSIWEDLAKVDLRINVGDWKESLKVLASFNGVQYNRGSQEGEAYREEIVSSICKEIPPKIKLDDSHIQGRSILCKELRYRIDQIRAMTKKGFCLIGIYGMGGIGKTTMCKILCNEFQEMEGNVSHVEFGSGTYKELLMKVLKDLKRNCKDFIQQCEEDECKHILLNDIGKDKVFLAIDNVWNDSKSIEEAKVYLRAHFHEESIVMVTSRSLETLTFLGIDKSHCFEMPNLEHEDAMNLFLHHAAHGTKFSSYNIDDVGLIERCIALCYFCKGKHLDGHYLPLALKALGVQLGCIGRCPLKWVEALPDVKDFNYLQEEENPVFSILRSSFDCLLPMHQALFMDLIVYSPIVAKWTIGNDDWILDARILDDWTFGNATGLIEWLSIVHNKEIHDIESQLQHLKGRGLVDDVDIASQQVYIHDLYREFAKFESKGNLEEKSWVYYEDANPKELEMTPSNKCWQKLKRIRILESKSNLSKCVQIESLQDIEWRYFSNVVVLKLDGLLQLRGELNLKGLKCLRSLDITEINGLDSLDGLQDLNNLTYFKWITNERGTVMLTRIGKLPRSLKILHLDIGVWLRPDMFASCTKLSKVNLDRCRAEKLDLSQCALLHSLTLEDVELLLDDLLEQSVDESQELHNRTIFMLEAKWTLDFWDVEAMMQQVQGILKVLDVETLLKAVVFAHDASMSKLKLMGCHVVNLHFHNCASLQSVILSGCCFEKLDFKNCPTLQTIILQDVPGLENMDGLQDLSYINYIPNLWEDKVEVYPRMGQLPASLETLVLDFGVLLVSNVFACCTNLEIIKLRKCRAKKLDLSQCASLHSLMLEDVELALDDLLGVSVDESQELHNHTIFKLEAKWTPNFWDVEAMMQQVQGTLKVLDVETLLRVVVFAHDASMSALKLMECRIVNLHFHNCAYLQSAKLSGCFEKLDFKNCPTLQTIILQDVHGLGSVDGLQDLNNLTDFKWIMNERGTIMLTRIGKLPPSLKILHLDIGVWLRPDMTPCCTKLSTVNLGRCHVEKLDLSQCALLHSLTLEDVELAVDDLLGVSVDENQELHNHTIFKLEAKWTQNCWDVKARMQPIRGMLKVLDVETLLKAIVFAHDANMSKLKLMGCHVVNLHFHNCASLQSVILSGCCFEKLDFKNCPTLQTIILQDVPGLENVDGLQDLSYINYIPNLWEDKVEAYPRMGQLPASLETLVLDFGVLLVSNVFACCSNLKRIKLHKCHAEKLDLSQCTSLHSLMLEDVELALDDLLGVSADESQKLHNCTIFKFDAKWTQNCWDVKARMQPIQGMLKVLDVETMLRAIVFAHEASMSELKLMGCHVVNLHFHNCASLQSAKLSGCCFEKLDFKNCPTLQTIILQDVHGLGSVDGLQDLNNLTSFKWIKNERGTIMLTRIGKLPPSLQNLHLDIGVWLSPDLFACCTKLRKVNLRRCRAEKLDLSQCASLYSLTLEDVELVLNDLLRVSIDESQELHNCTIFMLEAKWTLNCWDVKARMQQGQGMLKVLNVETLLRVVVFAHDASMSALKLTECRVVNLHFHNCASLQSVILSGCCFEKLDFENCPTLQTIVLQDVNESSSIFGLSMDRLQDLNNLSNISSRQNLYDKKAHVFARVGQLPASLEVLELDVDVLLRQDVFSWCTNLREVNLMKGQAEDMDFSNCKALESVSLGDFQGVETLLGLQKLNNLTCFSWSLKWIANHVYSRIMGQLPTSIEVLKLNVDVLLELDAFACWTNLREVDLTRCRAEKLDFSNILALQKVRLSEVQGLQTVVGLKNLNNLIYFSLLHTRSHNANHICPRIMGQFPVSLEVLELCVEASLIPDVFARCADCTNLRTRYLWKCQFEKLDFKERELYNL